MHGFQIDEELSQLTDRHPAPEVLKKVITNSTRRGREIFVRLWLTEGEPFAFRECPGIFEDLRGWLANRLSLHAKDFTLLGSARSGFSLAPHPKYGRRFSEASDLDFAAVSSQLFRDIQTEFNAFVEDNKNGTVKPNTDYEKRCWHENIEFGHRNFPKGFFDAKKLPNFSRYARAQQINQAMWRICKKLENTQFAPTPKSASLRVYRDWGALVDRVSFNLMSALQER